MSCIHERKSWENSETFYPDIFLHTIHRLLEVKLHSRFHHIQKSDRVLKKHTSGATIVGGTTIECIINGYTSLDWRRRNYWNHWNKSLHRCEPQSAIKDRSYHFHSSMVSLLSKTVKTCNELPFMLFAVVRIALPLFAEVRSLVEEVALLLLANPVGEGRLALVLFAVVDVTLLLLVDPVTSRRTSCLLSRWGRNKKALLLFAVIGVPLLLLADSYSRRP